MTYTDIIATIQPTFATPAQLEGLIRESHGAPYTGALDHLTRDQIIKAAYDVEYELSELKFTDPKTYHLILSAA